MITLIFFTVVAGILVGFATSARRPTDGLEDLTRNIVVGMVGAFVGLQVVGAIYGSAQPGASAMVSIIAAIAGATLVLVIVNRVRKA